MRTLSFSYASLFLHLVSRIPSHFFLFFFNDTATTEIYTLSLHDALPISRDRTATFCSSSMGNRRWRSTRSEEHTSELQSQFHLVCRLLLEKKKNTLKTYDDPYILEFLLYPLFFAHCSF